MHIPADVVLGSDVVYDPDGLPPLVEQLHLQLAQSASYALIASVARNTDTLARFVHMCTDVGLTSEEVHRRRGAESACTPAIMDPQLGDRHVRQTSVGHLSSTRVSSVQGPGSLGAAPHEQASKEAVGHKVSDVRMIMCRWLDQEQCDIVLHRVTLPSEE